GPVEARIHPHVRHVIAQIPMQDAASGEVVRRPLELELPNAFGDGAAGRWAEMHLDVPVTADRVVGVGDTCNRPASEGEELLRLGTRDCRGKTARDGLVDALIAVRRVRGYEIRARTTRI